MRTRSSRSDSGNRQPIGVLSALTAAIRRVSLGNKVEQKPFVKPQLARKVLFETLEQRILLSASPTPLAGVTDGTLTTSLTDGDDNVLIEQIGPSATTGFDIQITVGDYDPEVYTGVDSIVVDGLEGDDTFEFVDITVDVDLTGGDGTDTLIGSNGSNTWTINDDNTGNLNDIITFSAIENLEGGTATDTLTGPDTDNTWNIGVFGENEAGAEIVVDATDAGTLNDTISFSAMENLVGGSAIDEFAFASDRRRMATLHRVGEDSAVGRAFGLSEGSRVVLEKGGVDSVLEVCTHAWTGSRAEPLDETLRARILKADEELAAQGKRVLGFAHRLVGDSEETGSDGLEHDLVFVGMMGLIDPPRPGVRDAVERCRSAGIRPVMITGDHPLTARVIAEELGIETAAGVVSGAQLVAASEAELQGLCRRVSVFARVAPEHKLRIVEALQSQGEAVAMTGDGVNDAPALKRADIGVAMGITGTDVSKEAADMVLLGDDFTTIVNAVEEGRVIHDNVRKFIKYTLASNAGEIWVMLLGPFLGMPLALLPLQVLWVNLVTDGLPGLALSVEPGERGIMERPPRARSESFLAGGLLRHVAWVSLLMGAVSLGVGWWYWRGGATTDHWRTMVFTVLTLSQLGHAMSVRQERDSIFRAGLLSNPLLFGSVVLTLGLQLGLIYWEPMRGLFHLTRLSAADLGLALAVSTIVFLTAEGAKLARRLRGVG